MQQREALLSTRRSMPVKMNCRACGRPTERKAPAWCRVGHWLLGLTLLLCLVSQRPVEGLMEQDGLAGQQCPVSAAIHLSLPGQHNVTYINSDANVLLTVLLPQVDCHRSTVAERRDSAIYQAAIRFALYTLNNASNDTSSILHLFPLFKNFLPLPADIKYGAKIIKIHATEPIESLQCKPELSAKNKLSVIKDLTILDGAQVFQKHGRSGLLEQVPIISLSSTESILSAPFKANLILSLLNTLKWQHFSVITSKDEDSLYIVKFLGQFTHSGQLCIADIFEIPDEENERNEESSLKQRFSGFMRNIHQTEKKLPIVVISNNEKHVSELIRIWQNNHREQMANHQIFVSLVPSPELLADLHRLSHLTTLLTLTAQLPRIPLLDQAQETNCDSSENSLVGNQLWTNWVSFLPIRSIYFVALAFNLASGDICKYHSQNSSWCQNLTNLEHREFFNYLNKLEDQIDMPVMSVSVVGSEQVHDFLVYDQSGFRVVTANRSVEASGCSSTEGHCESCIKFRQSRTFESDGVVSGHGAHSDAHVVLHEDESALASEDDLADIAMLHVETYEVALGLLLPLHQTGHSILHCSSQLNLPAYYIYEAARWIVDKINQNNYLIPGIEIKLELIDTCSSPFYATQELAHLTSSEAKVQPIAFVSSVPRDHYKQIVDFVSSINYTLIATQDISFMDFGFGPSHGILQTAISNQNLVRALVAQLKYFDWRYVSVVVDHEDLVSTSMLHYFAELAAHEKICFASVEHVSNFNLTLSKLWGNYQNGASVVVLLTNYLTTAKLMSHYQSALKYGHEVNENLHFVLLRDQNLEVIHGFEEQYLGSIFIRESIGSISHFDNHFMEMIANPRKDQLLYKFIQQCGPNGAQCLQAINSFDKTITANTMQAILAIVGGFARMRNETCSNEKGICNEMLSSDFHQKLLKFILNTRSMRIDSELDKRFKNDNFDIFEFLPDGSSARDIELLNFKHDFTNGLFRFDTVALYNHNTHTLERNQNVRYMFYKYNGLVNGQKEYNETEFIVSDCVNLKKCNQCEPQTPEFIYMPSWDNLMLSGIFDIHSHSSQNPFTCEKNQTNLDKVQNAEAFLWAIDLINNDPSILPGVHLGALVFDTCSSYQKIYRDVSNFLSNSLLLGDFKVQIPPSESVLGFVVDGSNTKIIDSILDLTNPTKLSVISLEARESKYNDPTHYSQFLSFSQPNSLYVDAILSILKKFSWSFVSVLYENDSLMSYRYLDAFSYFQTKASSMDIKIAVTELFNKNNMHNNVNNLNSFAQIGSKVIIVFLSPENLKNFLLFNSMLENEKRLESHEIVYICMESQEVLTQFARNNVNAISIGQVKRIIPEFKDYFLGLSLQSNAKNPWFTQLYEKVYQCEGFGCYKTHGSLKQKNVTVNPQTTNVINSVFALAHGLELIRQQLCPNNFNGLCNNFHSHLDQISRLEREMIRQDAFAGLDSSQIYFGPKSNYITGHVNIFNLYSAQWMPVGRFDLERGLIMDSAKSKYALNNGTTIVLQRFISVCQDQNKCDKLKVSSQKHSMLLIPSERAQATIAVTLPLHHSEHNLHNKTCGLINPEMFEKLMAFHSALDGVNQHSPIQLNALVIDNCAFGKETLQSLSSDYNLIPKIVSVITLSSPSNHLEHQTSNEFLKLLSDYNPFIYHFYHGKSEDRSSFFFNENNELNRKNNQMLSSRSVVDFCSKMKWHTVNLVYSNEFSKNYFTFESNKNNICIDQTFQVTINDIARSNFQREWNDFANKLDTHVIVFLTSSDINEFLIKYSEKNLLERFIWIGDKNLKTALIHAQKNFKKDVANSIVLKRLSKEDSNDNMETSSTLDKVSTYLDIHNEKLQGRMLSGWLHEYWQRKFHCFVNNKQLDAKCFDRKYARKALVNGKEIKQLMNIVQVLGNSISSFAFNKCNNGSNGQVDDLCFYNYHLRNELKNNIIDGLNQNLRLSDTKINSADGFYEVEVLTNSSRILNIFNSMNMINVTRLMGHSLHLVTSCRNRCDFCTTQLLQSRNKSTNLLFSDSIQSPLTGSLNLNRTWSITASILSTLGLIMVLICVLYFILIFPVALGTTIIGYQILFGLFVAFLINFAYLLPTTFTMCWIRHIGLPFAYCIILSGFFVKVYNYWCHILLKKTTKTLKYNSPMAQISLSLVFVVLEVVIMLVTVHYAKRSVLTNEAYPRCNLINGHEFVLSQPQVIFPMALLAALFVCILFFTVKTVDNGESRWILACTASTALIWFTWLLYCSIYPLKGDSMPTVLANLSNAFLIIVLLYIRKLYLFSKISRKILKERRLNMEGNMQFEPFAEGQQQYGAFKSCTDNIAWSNMHDRINFRNATRSPFEGDNEDNISSCGSVKSSASSQVQCQELYPMEVYDNQLSQANSKIGQSTRSIYDIIDDANIK